jgi:hypothetical protein
MMDERVRSNIERTILHLTEEYVHWIGEARTSGPVESIFYGAGELYLRAWEAREKAEKYQRYLDEELGDGFTRRPSLFIPHHTGVSQ